jgi:hypothetical protein
LLIKGFGKPSDRGIFSGIYLLDENNGLGEESLAVITVIVVVF